MNRFSPVQIRFAVIFGFTLSAAAGIISYVDDVSMHAVQFASFQDVVNPLIGPLTAIAAVIAWSWLTKVEPRDDAQRKTLRAAYLFFAIQYLLFAAGYNFIFTPPRSFGNSWITTYLWLDFFGAVVATIGLFLTFLSLTPGSQSESSSLEVNEVS